MPVLEKISFENFRNLSNDIITLEPTVNCIFGENGNGKTNLLEAIYLSINKKSFRKKALFQQLLSIDCAKPEIISKLTTRSDDILNYYALSLSKEKFICIKNNSKKITKIDLNCIFISPFDSFNFHNDPSFRRSLLDTLISKMDTSYKKELLDYNKLQKQKNHVLKTTKNNAILNAIDGILSSKFEFLNKVRLSFIKSINPLLELTYKEIFSEDANLKLSLNSKFNGLSSEACYDLLLNHRDTDLLSRHSKISLNKDEVVLNFNGFDSVEFCSLGQQKTAYLSLLFAYINLFRYKFKVFPIVLIDDVSGELDSTRLDLLIRYLFNSDYQVVLTTANHEFKNKLKEFGSTNLVSVKDGYFN